MNRQAAWALTACALLAAPSWAKDASRRIDDRLEAAWAAAGVTPAAAADDAEFLRRAYLDLTGRIPTVAEARAFLADRRPDRRVKLIDELLASPRFVTHFTRVYRNLLIPEQSSNLQVRLGIGPFDRWLEDWLASGKGYDALVRELLTAPLAGAAGPVFAIGGRTSPSPALFYTAKESKPEEIAADVSRTFLGVNLGCAQCHNHPFASWQRDQFWSFAAFFSGIQSQRMGDFRTTSAEVADRHEITIPGTEKVVKAKYLDGTAAKVAAGESSRRKLADWVTARDNPYFARAAVNRAWAHFFGTGLMEPLDEMAGGEGAPSHPEVLDDLAKGFVASGYDMRWLIRTITATRAYQLSSARTHPSQDGPTRFARAAVRGLTGDQLYDSLVTATGHRDAPDRAGRAAFLGGSAREQFLTKFTSAGERPVDVQASILQALTLMNGRLMTSATKLDESETLRAVADAPYLDVAGKVEALYLATLSRRPTGKEADRALAYVGKAADPSKGDAAKRRGEALADVFWVLLNSGEFYFNH
ncbi:MAG: DUF1549 domain-containing protein [Gemmataceae bacterium]